MRRPPPRPPLLAVQGHPDDPPPRRQAGPQGEAVAAAGMGGTVKRQLAAGRVWGLPVLWLCRREPDLPQVIVVFVDAAGRRRGRGRRAQNRRHREGSSGRFLRQRTREACQNPAVTECLWGGRVTGACYLARMKTPPTDPTGETAGELPGKRCINAAKTSRWNCSTGTVKAGRQDAPVQRVPQGRAAPSASRPGGIQSSLADGQRGPCPRSRASSPRRESRGGEGEIPALARRGAQGRIRSLRPAVRLLRVG